MNDEVVSAFDPAKEAERAWFEGGYDSPFLLLYEKEEEEEEEEGVEGGREGGRGGLRGSVSDQHSVDLAPIHPGRLEAMVALITGLTTATLQATPPSLPSSLSSHPSASHLLIPDVQKLLALFHWLASSFTKQGRREDGREGGAMEALLLQDIKQSAGLLRRFLLSPSPHDKAKDSLAHWLLTRLGKEGGWMEGMFLGPSSLPSSSSQLEQGMRGLWVGVAEAALDRVVSQSASPQTENTIQGLGEVLFPEEGEGGREGGREDGLEVLRERVRPYVNVPERKAKRAREEEEEREEGEDEEEDEEGRRRRRRGGMEGQGAADAG